MTLMIFLFVIVIGLFILLIYLDYTSSKEYKEIMKRIESIEFELSYGLRIDYKIFLKDKEWRKEITEVVTEQERRTRILQQWMLDTAGATSHMLYNQEVTQSMSQEALEKRNREIAEILLERSKVNETCST